MGDTKGAAFRDLIASTLLAIATQVVILDLVMWANRLQTGLCLFKVPAILESALGRAEALRESLGQGEKRRPAKRKSPSLDRLEGQTPRDTASPAEVIVGCVTTFRLRML